MAAAEGIDPTGWLDDQLATASPDLLRSMIETVANEMDFLYPWIESERARLLALADDYDWSQNLRSQDWLAHQHYVRQGKFPDHRSREVYESHVEDYLMQASEVFVQRQLLLIEDHLPANVQLIVDNPTDLHFRGIELTMWFEGPVRGFDDDLRYSLPTQWPALPPVPAPPGTGGNYLTYRKVMSVPNRVIPKTRDRAAAKGEDVLGGWSGESLKRGIVVRFDHFDLRPRQGVRLVPVPLKVLVEPGSSLVGHWTATADDANGEFSGELVYAVQDSTVDLAELAEPAPPTENQLPPAEMITVFAAALAAMKSSRTHPQEDA